MNSRLMHWYIGKTTFLAMVVVLLCGTLLMFVFTLLDKLQASGNEGGFGEAILQAFRALPRKIEELAPFATFLGVLLGIGSLSSNSELTVFRSAGISMTQVFLAVCIPSVVMMAIAQVLIPLAFATDERGEVSRQQGVTGAWVREGDTFTRIGSLDQGDCLVKVDQYILNSPTELDRVDSAATGERDEGIDGWRLKDVASATFEHDRINLDEADESVWHTSRTAESLTTAFTTEPRKMSLLQLAEQIDDLKAASQNPTEFQVEYWTKLTKPLSVLGLVLIALGFVVGSTREMGMGARLTFGIAVGFAFHYFQTLVAPMTIVFALPPAVAIGVPIVMVWLIGSVLIRRVA